MASPPDETWESPETALREIRQGHIAPCYLLWGEEEFHVKETLSHLIDAILPSENRDMNLYYYDGEKIDLKNLILNIQTTPLIPDRKLVVVLNSELFQSKQTSPDLADRVREQLEDNPLQAARTFLRFLSSSGFSLDDLKEDGWKEISPDDWRKHLSPEAWEERMSWLPQVIALSAEQRLAPANSQDESQDLIEVLMRGLPEGNHLILTASLVDRRKKLYKVIGELGKIHYFAKPKAHSQKMQVLIESLRGLLARAGKEMTTEAWTVLGARVGFDLQKASQAMEKLINFAAENKRITEHDVEEVVGKSTDDTVFNLVTAVLNKDLAQSMEILDSLLLKINHMIIFSFFVREMRFLKQAKLLLETKELANFKTDIDYSTFQRRLYPKVKELSQKQGKSGSLVGQHPYVIYNALKNCVRFRHDELLHLLDHLLEIDLALKTTAKDPRLLLERFIIQVCTQAERRGVF